MFKYQVGDLVFVKGIEGFCKITDCMFTTDLNIDKFTDVYRIKSPHDITESPIDYPEEDITLATPVEIVRRKNAG